MTTLLLLVRSWPAARVIGKLNKVWMYNPRKCWSIVITNMLTGYGPRTGPLFDGDERKLELWEIKFRVYLRLKKLDTIFTPSVTLWRDKSSRCNEEYQRICSTHAVSRWQKSCTYHSGCSKRRKESVGYFTRTLSIEGKAENHNCLYRTYFIKNG